MGSEQFYPAQTRLTRRNKKNDADDELIVVGGGDQLIVTSAIEFGPNRPLDIVTAREDYDAELPEGAEVGAVERATTALTPEQQFAKAARDNPPAEAPKGRQGRKRSDGPTETREGGE
jgi:hypothetical protein